MKVILISGKAQHGKDTFADFFKTTAEIHKKKCLIIKYGDILKFVCIFAVMVGQDPHRWAPSKGSVLFSYLWQKIFKH